MSPALRRGNQWALKAPVLITLVTRLDTGIQSNGLNYALYDCGLAAMSLAVEAESRGLRTHQMAGWLIEPLSGLLELPEGVTPVTVIAVGYEGDAGNLEPGLAEKERKPRTRKILGAILNENTWNSDWDESPADA